MEPSFEWDQDKEAQNIAKHGLSFEEAQRAFLDPLAVIADDAGHSGQEQRWFCFGKVGGGIATVRFTWRGSSIRIIGAKGGGSMKKPIRYTDEPIKVGKIVPNFLPKPEDLVLRESNVRVTLNLSAASLRFFRELGRKSRIPYQKLIRRYLDELAHEAQRKGLKPSARA